MLGVLKRGPLWMSQGSEEFCEMKCQPSICCQKQGNNKPRKSMLASLFSDFTRAEQVMHRSVHVCLQPEEKSCFLVSPIDWMEGGEGMGCFVCM